jgi:hypothetical protein
MTRHHTVPVAGEVIGAPCLRQALLDTIRRREYPGITIRRRQPSVDLVRAWRRLLALVVLAAPASAAAWPQPPAAAAPPPVEKAEKPPSADAGQAEGPMRPEAQALYDRGLARFQAREYPGAISDFEAGYAIEPRREFLFAEGQAKRLGGDCKGAVALYQRFLATNPPPLQASATHIALGRCAQHMADHPEVVLVPPPPTPPSVPPPPPRWWRDPIGLGATGAGVVALGIGLGFWIASGVAEDDAGDSSTQPDYDRRWATAGSRRAISVGALVTGAVLTAAGVTRLMLVRRDAAKRDAGPSLSIGPGMISVTGRF